MRFLLLLLLVGCAVDDTVDSTRIIYSEAGGMLSMFSGKIKTCAVITTKGYELEIRELKFDASQNLCIGLIGEPKPEEEITE